MQVSELLPILTCPICNSHLSSIETCDTCGHKFSLDKGVPSFLVTDISRRVTFDFTPDRATRNARFEAVLRYPPTSGVAADGPYHLDSAHLGIIDKLAVGSLTLEIGCGGGQMREFLAARGIGYVGTDISPKERVTADLQRFGGPDLLADAHFLPFADASFDLVYSAAVTEHLANPFLAVQEVFRVLKPGGHYLGNCSFLEPWHDDSFFHLSPLGAWELLTQAGFTIDYIWPGKGYSGYRALMKMGNRATKSVSFIGDALYGLYGIGIALRERKGREARAVADDAQVAGATDWIAHKPAVTSS